MAEDGLIEGWLTCEFREIQDGEEVTVGVSDMAHAPRVGEKIWLRRYDKLGTEIYTIIDVSYLVNDISDGQHAYAKAIVHVESRADSENG